MHLRALVIPLVIANACAPRPPVTEVGQPSGASVVDAATPIAVPDAATDGADANDDGAAERRLRDLLPGKGWFCRRDGWARCWRDTEQCTHAPAIVPGAEKPAPGEAKCDYSDEAWCYEHHEPWLKPPWNKATCVRTSKICELDLKIWRGLKPPDHVSNCFLIP
jgi:hypothetical protein